MTGQERATMVERWLHLTRRVMPAMAADHRWPVRLDHCFMRICLDAALGTPWHSTVRPPAIRNLTPEQLRDVVAVAERVVAEPGCLPQLNAASLSGRRAFARARDTAG